MKYDDRWNDGAIKTVIDSLNNKNVISPFPNTDSGHIDLRGLLIKEFIRGVAFNRVDATSLRIKLAGQFGFCEFHDCILIDADLRTNIGSLGIATNFKGASFSGGIIRGLYTNCDFTGCNFTSLRASEVTFSDCNFSSVQFRKAELCNCKFINCIWTEAQWGGGSLYKSVITGGNFNRDEIKDTLL